MFEKLKSKFKKWFENDSKWVKKCNDTELLYYTQHGNCYVGSVASTELLRRLVEYKKLKL